MTASKGEIRGHDRVAPATKTFTHVNGVHTELEHRIGGTWFLPRRWTCLSTGSYHVHYNATDVVDGTALEDTIPAIAGVSFRSCPHRLDSDSTDGMIITCEY